MREHTRNREWCRDAAAAAANRLTRDKRLRGTTRANEMCMYARMCPEHRYIYSYLFWGISIKKWIPHRTAERTPQGWWRLYTSDAQIDRGFLDQIRFGRNSDAQSTPQFESPAASTAVASHYVIKRVYNFLFITIDWLTLARLLYSRGPLDAWLTRIEGPFSLNRINKRVNRGCLG